MSSQLTNRGDGPWTLARGFGQYSVPPSPGLKSQPMAMTPPWRVTRTSSAVAAAGSAL